MGGCYSSKSKSDKEDKIELPTNEERTSLLQAVAQATELSAANTAAMQATLANIEERMTGLKNLVLDTRVDAPVFSKGNACEYQGCGMQLGVMQLKPRHHCRHCGGTMCDEHSTSRRPIEAYGMEVMTHFSHHISCNGIYSDHPPVRQGTTASV